MKGTKVQERFIVKTVVFFIMIMCMGMNVDAFSDDVPAVIRKVIDQRMAIESNEWHGSIKGVFEKQQNYVDDKQINGEGEFASLFNSGGVCFSFLFRVEGNPLEMSVYALYDNTITSCDSTNTARINDGFIPFDPFDLVLLPHANQRKGYGYAKLWMAAISKVRLIDETDELVTFDILLADGFIRYCVESKGEGAGRIHAITWHLGDPAGEISKIFQRHEYTYDDDNLIPSSIEYSQFDRYPMPDGTVKSVVSVNYRITIMSFDPTKTSDNNCSCRYR